MEQRHSIVSAVIRLLIAAAAIIIQIGVYFFVSAAIREYAFTVYVLMEVFTVIMSVYIMCQPGDTSYRMLWIIIVLILPVTGVLIYMTWGRAVPGGRYKKRLSGIIPVNFEELSQNPVTLESFGASHPRRLRIARYLNLHGFPLYDGTGFSFFPLGDSLFDSMIEDIEKAENFVFLEYFIISQGKVWDRLQAALERKAAQGVDVRIIYDDFGSLLTVPRGFRKKLARLGIKTAVFNPIHMLSSRLYLNCRNHRKITVIDGDIGYTGGVNISDEYSNLIEKHGHWKDTAVRLTGRAVWSMTVTFMHMWNFAGRGDKLICTEHYLPKKKVISPDPGFFQFFADGPDDSPDNPALITYKQIISEAQDYVYITSPYLILDDGMTEALVTAARSGTDIRVFTPHVPDHWYVHMATRSCYGALLKAGVRIYEYTPGFLHAKMLVSDDSIAIIGSVNMDYRSFHLNYECGVLSYGGHLPSEIRGDILKTLESCSEVSYEKWLRRPWYHKAAQFVIKIFAPLF